MEWECLGQPCLILLDQDEIRYYIYEVADAGLNRYLPNNRIASWGSAMENCYICSLNLHKGDGVEVKCEPDSQQGESSRFSNSSLWAYLRNSYVLRTLCPDCAIKQQAVNNWVPRAIFFSIAFAFILPLILGLVQYFGWD